LGKRKATNYSLFIFSQGNSFELVPDLITKGLFHSSSYFLPRGSQGRV